jgi:hypothetical protein
MITYTLRYSTSAGSLIGFINDFESCRYVIRGDGGVGAMELVVPVAHIDWFNPQNVDYRLTVWRSINNQQALLEGATEFLTVGWEITDERITVTAMSLQSLLQRRIVAYYAGLDDYSKFTSKYAGNVMKTLVRTNCTSAFAANRDGVDTYVAMNNLTVNGDNNDGVSLSYSCSRNNLLDAITAISQSSTQAGFWIVGQVTSNGDGWTFDSYPYYFGQDRRGQSILSVGNRNVEQVKLTYDRTTEYTAVIAAGSGTESARFIGTNFSAEVTASPYNRKELFYTNPQLKSQVLVDAAAYNLTRANRATFSFSAALLQTPQFVRGVDYNVGDILTVEFNGTQYTTRLDIVDVSISSNGVVERAELRLV